MRPAFRFIAEATSGMDRARARVQSFDEEEIAWQITVIRENTSSVSKSAGQPAGGVELKRHLRPDVAVAPTKEIFVAEADKIAEELSGYAIRRGPGAAWIGLDWLGDSEVFQLVCLGPDLYNGVSGIAVFLAAHAAVTGHKPSGELALAGMSHLRKNLKSRNAARMARSLGIGGATGLGSIVYALTVMSKCLHDDELACGRPCGGGAVHRRPYCGRQTAGRYRRQCRCDTRTSSSLSRYAIQRRAQARDEVRRTPASSTRAGPEGRRSWSGQGSGPQAP